MNNTRYDKKNFKNHNADLLKNKDRLEFVKENIDIIDETVKECCIGCNKENDVYMLPMTALDETITCCEIQVPENNKGKFKFLSEYADILSLIRTLHIPKVVLKNLYFDTCKIE